MNLVPHLEEIADKWPRCGARRRGIFSVVQLGFVMMALSAPEGHQEEGEKTETNSDTRHGSTRVLLDGQSPKHQFHLLRKRQRVKVQNICSREERDSH